MTEAIIFSIPLVALIVALFMDLRQARRDAQAALDREFVANERTKAAEDRLWEAQKLVTRMLFRKDGTPPMSDPDDDEPRSWTLTEAEEARLERERERPEFLELT